MRMHVRGVYIPDGCCVLHYMERKRLKYKVEALLECVGLRWATEKGVYQTMPTMAQTST